MSECFGLERDPSKSAELYQKAAQQGLAEAYYVLGKSYYEGIEVERDQKKARQYWKLGAIKGHLNARHQLGWLEGNSDNHERACKHFLINAKSGLEMHPSKH